MDGALFNRFRQIARDTAGIHLGDGKESLVAARVAKRQRQLGIPDERDYLHYLEGDQSGNELVHFLDAISTNFTSFFREPEHFELLDQIVREATAAPQHRLRIWCAASSSGEEPYSIAITVLEAAAGRPLDVRILATDISTRVLDHAQRGIYEAERLKPLSRKQLERFFCRVPDEDGVKAQGPRYEVAAALRAPLVFRRLNLATPPLPMRGPLDVVFCRNVMMYFDRAVRQRLVEEIERLLRPGGYLLTGHAETLNGLSTSLVAERPSVYRQRELLES